MLGVTGLYETHEPPCPAPTGTAAHDLVEVVTGAAAVAQHVRQAWLGACEDACALVVDGPGVAYAPENTSQHGAHEGAAGPRVRRRVVVERGVLGGPHGAAGLPGPPGRNERVRVVDRVPTRLVIVDRRLALLPLVARGSEPAVLVVRAGGPLELLRALFESVWQDALPLRCAATGGAERAPDGPDTTDLEILSLLLAGLTDASVAKQLDVGLRTVQRRVKRLMELAGVTTRLQLGWHAYERGWVTRGR
ncbi:LuxR family transcriptional regulator [Streptomyces griseus]|uniref:helix-turn-helix transcriptional regulator n=1 Tax=Streptomyces griseus TaxID=1911 RepID=UPI0006914B5D